MSFLNIYGLTVLISLTLMLLQMNVIVTEAESKGLSLVESETAVLSKRIIVGITLMTPLVNLFVAFYFVYNTNLEWAIRNNLIE